MPAAARLDEALEAARLAIECGKDRPPAGLAVAWVGKRPILWVFGIAWPVAMFFAVVMTGNHFILDAVIGGAVSFAGLGIALGLERARPRIMAWAKGRMPAPGGKAVERATP